MNCPWCGYPNFEVRCSACGAREPKRDWPRCLIALLMLVLASGQWWEIDFPANAANVWIQVDTECKGKDGTLNFLAIDSYQIEPEDTHARMRRQPTPKGERCTVKVGTLDDKRYYTDVVILIQED